MANEDVRRKSIRGSNIYYDENRIIYYDPLTKKAHQITKGDEKKYVLFQSSIPLACLAGLLIAYYTKKYILAFIVGLIIYLAIYLFFRFVFIANLPIYPKFKKTEKPNYFDAIAQTNPKTKLVTTVIVMIILAIFISYNAYKEQYEPSIMALNYGFAALFAGISIVNFIALIKKINR